ncbi:hypothetical protein [Halorussus litoreus]|uniref:hypothetical protein n=1 Tax=Halorussus litoreus TaxID=1710536 RepID=UPI000E285E9F|nr:hypothetical protein [Halorussus litoreus]
MCTLVLAWRVFADAPIAAAAVMRDHDLGTCVLGTDFGTRSSSLIAVGADGDARYWFADGRPCETEYDVVDSGGDPVDESETDDADGQI